MAEDMEGLSSYQRLLLNMEGVIEERIEIDRKACVELDKDWEELYDGECDSCGRIYEATYLVGLDYQADPFDDSPERGDCIPCWRKKNDLPKIDRDRPKEAFE